MTQQVIRVRSETPLREAARLLAAHEISGMPVVADDGACIGVISEADLLVKQAAHAASGRRALDWIFGDRQEPDQLRRRAATMAGEAMSSPPIVIAPDRPLREAATLMVDRGVNRLPVVEDGQLVGIVSRADLVAAYLRLDAEIVRLVRDDVLRRALWLEPADFDVAASDGIVRIAGLVDRKSTAGIIVRLIGVMDGVVEVDSELTWELDDTALGATAETEREPTAANATARSHPQPLHR